MLIIQSRYKPQCPTETGCCKIVTIWLECCSNYTAVVLVKNSAATRHSHISYRMLGLLTALPGEGSGKLVVALHIVMCLVNREKQLTSQFDTVSAAGLYHRWAPCNSVLGDIQQCDDFPSHELLCLQPQMIHATHSLSTLMSLTL